MVDYARFYVNPAPQVADNMTALANAARYREQMGMAREKMAQDLQQQGFANNLALAKYGLDVGKEDALQRQRGLENYFIAQRLGIDQQAETRQRENMAREVAEKQFGMMAGMMSGVDDDESYQSYRSMLKSMVDNKMLPKEFYEQTPEEYNPEEFKRARDFVRGAAGKETYETYEQGGMLMKREKGSGDTEVLDRGDEDRAPNYKTYLVPGAKEPLTIDVNKEQPPRNAVPWSKDIAKPEMTKGEAMKEVARLEALQLKIEGTGGLEEGLFAELAKSSPTLASALQGSDKSFAKEAIQNYIRHLEDNFIKPGKDSSDPLGLYED